MKFSRFQIEQTLCRRCGACLRACKSGAIFEAEDKRILIDPAKCTDCSDCYEACKLRAVVRKKGIFHS